MATRYRVDGQVLNGNRVVSKKSFFYQSLGQARFEADVWAETKYNVMKGEGKKVTGYRSKYIA